MPKIVVLWSDLVVWASLVLALVYALRVRASAHLRQTWLQVLRDPAAMASVLVLALFFALAVLDSLHFRRALPEAAAAGAAATPQRTAYGTRTESLLDVALARQVAGRETSYSAPLAIRGFTKDTVQVGGQTDANLAAWRKIAEETAWKDFAAKSTEAADLLKLARTIA